MRDEPVQQNPREVMMSAHRNYDAIVIGGSAASVSHLCPYLAQAGLKTAIVERAHLGGTCVNVGCMPTKTMAASARVSHVVRRAAAYGVQTASVNVDMARVQQRTHDLVLRLRKSEADVIEKA
jgi:pyruvate/2-oxoglutarate dehydrogenase complex dihydrolipoamide dehydrogenase (E3) component